MARNQDDMLKICYHRFLIDSVNQTRVYEPTLSKNQSTTASIYLLCRLSYGRYIFMPIIISQKTILKAWYRRRGGVMLRNTLGLAPSSLIIIFSVLFPVRTPSNHSSWPQHNGYSSPYIHTHPETIHTEGIFALLDRRCATR